MRHLFSRPLGSCAPPQAPMLKYDPFSLGAGIVGSVVNAISTMYTNESNESIANQANLYNKANNELTNKTNKEIADEANRYNKLLQDEQNAWNLEQWNRENEYNSPENQVKRLKAAGINPYALYGSAGGSIPAGQLTSADAKPAAVAQMQQALPAAVSYNTAPQLADLGNLMADIRLKDKQADKIGADTQIARNVDAREAQMFPSKMKWLEEHARGEGILADMARETLNYYQISRKYDLAKLMNDVRAQSENFRLMQEQRNSLNLQNKLAEVQLAYAPKLNDAQLKQYYATVNQIKANIGLINANMLLTDQQKLTEIDKRVGIVLDNSGKGLDNQLKKQMMSTTIQLAKQELEQEEFITRNQQSAERYRRFTAVIPFASGYNSSASKRVFGVK